MGYPGWRGRSRCGRYVAFAIETLIKFLEAMPQISSVATNAIKLPSPKMADTSKDELLLSKGIRHVTVRRCITRTVNKFLLA